MGSLCHSNPHKKLHWMHLKFCVFVNGECHCTKADEREKTKGLAEVGIVWNVSVD
jgi:hypothetical protein